MADGVKLVRCDSNIASKHGCDHCHPDPFKKPTPLLALHFPSEAHPAFDQIIYFCISCGGSLGRALIQLSDLNKSEMANG